MMERAISNKSELKMKKRQTELALPNPFLEPTISVERAGQILGIGRSKAYELAQANKFPVEVLKIGRTYHVLTSSLVTTLGLDAFLTAPAVVTNLTTAQASATSA
jgi:hypothetical protein